MADAITIKALQDASLDAKSLEEVVNGNEVKQVTTRKGETYPSVKKAINTMFENGGLPATPFATKALMTASALVDGKYAMVTDDTVNNGLYVKTAGAWVESNYDPSVLFKDKLAELQSIFQGLLDDSLTYSNQYVSSGVGFGSLGQLVAAGQYRTSNIFILREGETLHYHSGGNGNVVRLSKWTAEGGFKEAIHIWEGDALEAGDNYINSYTAVEPMEFLRITLPQATLDQYGYKSTVENRKTFKDTLLDIEDITNLTNYILSIIQGSSRPLDTTWSKGYISSKNHTKPEGTITYQDFGVNDVRFSDLIKLNAGESIRYNGYATRNVLALSKWSEDGVFEAALVVGEEWHDQIMAYTAEEDCYIRINNYFGLVNSDIFIYTPSDKFSVSNSILARLDALEGEPSGGVGEGETLPNVYITPNKIRQPTINFQFDDGLSSDSTAVNIFKEYGLTCGFALISSKNNDFAKYRDFESQGFEVLSHSTVHVSMSGSGISESVMTGYLKNSLDALNEGGLTVRGWVTPMSAMHPNYLPLVRKYYEFAFTEYLGTWEAGQEGVPYNSKYEDTRVLKRVSMESSTIEDLKDAVDKVIESGEGMLSFYGHAVPASNLPEVKLRELLAYVKLKKEQGVCQVVTPTEAYADVFTLRHDELRQLL